MAGRARARVEAGERRAASRTGLLELPQVILSSIGAFLPKGQLLRLALVATGGAAFGAEVRELFLTPAPLLEDPQQPTATTWMAFVDRHAACLERLLRRLPRYVRARCRRKCRGKG
jgi:hypothetical protein